MLQFALDPCPEEIQRLCYLITPPDYRTEGFWYLLVSIGLWVFLHFWAKEAAAMAFETHEAEQEGRIVGISSSTYVLVYFASRAGQVLAIASGLVGLSRLITGR